jgi:hypothetical protein
VDLAELTALQDGVVARRQLAEIGVSDSEIRRLLRRRDLVRVHAGVYVNHSGPLTRAQQRWVAVLACWPAALSHRSVVNPDGEGPVHVAVVHHRTIVPPSGVVVHRMADLDQDVLYEEFGVVVELDGRAFHDNAAAPDQDAARDLDHAVAAEGVTVRLTYGQVFRDGCVTIHKVAVLLQRRGWAGQLLRCPNCP